MLQHAPGFDNIVGASKVPLQSRVVLLQSRLVNGRGNCARNHIRITLKHIIHNTRQTLPHVTRLQNHSQPLGLLKQSEHPQAWQPCRHVSAEIFYRIENPPIFFARQQHYNHNIRATCPANAMLGAPAMHARYVLGNCATWRGHTLLSNTCGEQRKPCKYRKSVLNLWEPLADPRFNFSVKKKKMLKHQVWWIGLFLLVWCRCTACFALCATTQGPYGGFGPKEVADILSMSKNVCNETSHSDTPNFFLAQKPCQPFLLMWQIVSVGKIPTVTLGSSAAIWWPSLVLAIALQIPTGPLDCAANPRTLSLAYRVPS